MIGQQVAVFVDAGYFVEGVKRILDVTISTSSSRFSIKNFTDQIEVERSKFCPESRLLRIYWYDAVLRSKGPTQFQIKVSEFPNIKLRLGRLIEGEDKPKQKGVDFILSTDLIKLSEHGAISDAILLTGDGDFTKAVEISQNFGVRLHLIGIGGDRGSSKTSGELFEEADTRSFWNEGRMKKLFEPARNNPEIQ